MSRQYLVKIIYSFISNEGERTNIFWA